MMKMSFRDFYKIHERLRTDPTFTVNDMSLDERRVYCHLLSDQRTQIVNEYATDQRTKPDVCHD